MFNYIDKSKYYHEIWEYLLFAKICYSYFFINLDLYFLFNISTNYASLHRLLLDRAFPSILTSGGLSQNDRGTKRGTYLGFRRA